MGRYTILRNSQLEIQLASDYQDNGWSLVDGNAVHDGLNTGYLRNFVFKTEPGEFYKISFTISGLQPGGRVRVYIGGVEFEITENGSYRREAVAIDNTGLVLWSDSDVIVSPMMVYLGEADYNTILYNPNAQVFDSYISFTSDYMIKLLGSFYSFKNGELWKHNDNEIRNSFYGVVNKSIIKFVFNPEPSKVKNLYNVKVNGNRAWDLMNIFVLPHEGKPNGQRSRLSKNRFESLQGDFHASFLKDMSDPRFQNQLQALFEGADLQGKLVEVTMEIDGGEEMKLVNIDFTYSESNYTY